MTTPKSLIIIVWNQHIQYCIDFGTRKSTLKYSNLLSSTFIPGLFCKYHIISLLVLLVGYV